MFTWISRASRFTLILWLAACQVSPGAFARPEGARQLAVLDGTIQVASPSGYCVDKASARQQDDGAVVLIGRCSAGSQLPAALISVTIGGVASASVLADGGAALAAYFQTSQGRAALSQSGRAETVQVAQTETVDGAFVMRIAESDAAEYWRAVLGISGRLVTLSVQAPQNSLLAPGAGQQLLTATITAMRRANPKQ